MVVKDAMIKSRPKDMGNRNMDLSRYTRWPRYIKIQRHKRVLQERLKVPAQIHHFSHALEKNTATALVKFLSNYQPEDRIAKKARLQALAAAKAEGKTVEQKKPIFAKYGVKHVTSLIEKKQAKLVVIATDVDPIEIVLHLPTLCRKMDVPYCFVKGKAVLGQVVHMKTCATLAITDVREEDARTFKQLEESIGGFMETANLHAIGGGKLGHKSQMVVDIRAARVKHELASRKEL